MVGDISAATRTEVLGANRSRYREASKKDKSRMLDEFVAIASCHRKYAVSLLGQCEQAVERTVPRGQRIYDEAVRQALIVVWEASDPTLVSAAGAESKRRQCEEALQEAGHTMRPSAGS